MKTLKDIEKEVIEQHKKGLLDDDIKRISNLYEIDIEKNTGLILSFISESIFYQQSLEQDYDTV
tara:strand:- start:8241 stop:8432 length:192 start_codon:yes stop_codon:yes gene_type:complete